MKNILREYDSVSEFLADIGRPDKGVSQISQDINEPFYWTKNYQQAHDLFTSGWAEGVERVNKHRDGLSAFIEAAKAAKAKSFAWDVVGDYIDVGRVLTGEAECCGAEADYGDQLAARVVSIRLNTCVSGSVDAGVIAARGVTVLLAVDLLESCGIRCEVIVAQSSDGHGLKLDSNVCVKKAGEPVDPDRLAFTVAHPAFFRRFGFRFMELYGQSPCGAYPSRLQDYGQRPGVIEIDEILTGAGLNPEQLKKNVISIATKCGLEFDDEQLASIGVSR